MFQKLVSTRSAGARALGCALALAFALAPLAATAAVEPARKGATVTGVPLQGVVNVNSASLEQLQALPGVGEARAQAIVVTRKERGGFKSVDELTEVRGIGDALLARLRPYVRTEGKTTVRVD
jgi:competence protein ComEA